MGAQCANFQATSSVNLTVDGKALSFSAADMSQQANLVGDEHAYRFSGESTVSFNMQLANGQVQPVVVTLTHNGEGTAHLTDADDQVRLVPQPPDGLPPLSNVNGTLVGRVNCPVLLQ